jgi:YVTN family beta-propeller protein
MVGSKTERRRAPRKLAIAAAVPVALVAGWAVAPALAAVDNGVCQTTAFAVAGNDAYLFPIDVPTGVAADPIDVGEGSFPVEVAITPDATTMLVAGLESVVRVDVASRTVTGSVDVPGSLQDIAITRDGTTAFVTQAQSNSVATIDVATLTKDPTDIAVGELPAGIAMSPDGTTAFVANEHSDTISTIDVATRVKDPVDISGVGPFPVGVAITPDGATAVVTNRMNDDTPNPDPTESGTVSTIDVATRTADPVDIGGFQMPSDVAITPDGSTAWISDVGGNVLSSIDLATRAKDPTDLAVGNQPTDVAITPDGKQLYVANDGGHTVSPVDLVARSVDPADQISIGASPGGIVFTPCQLPPPPSTTTTTARPATTTTTVPVSPAVVVTVTPQFTG